MSHCCNIVAHLMLLLYDLQNNNKSLIIKVLMTLFALPYRTHMQDLKETTDKVHYENFRQARMSHSYAGESNI